MTKENRIFEMSDEEYAAYEAIGPQENTIDWEDFQKTTNLRIVVRGKDRTLQQEVLLKGNRHHYVKDNSMYDPNILYMNDCSKSEWWDVPLYHGPASVHDHVEKISRETYEGLGVPPMLGPQSIFEFKKASEDKQ
jgi:hypothetical protein